MYTEVHNVAHSILRVLRLAYLFVRSVPTVSQVGRLSPVSVAATGIFNYNKHVKMVHVRLINEKSEPTQDYAIVGLLLLL